MFTTEHRAQIRSTILEKAKGDPRIVSAAITGSAAAGTEDRWSDIDLAFAVADGAEFATVLSEWTSYMYEKHSAIHHLDVPSGAWLYRAFLLPSTLQVDLGFVPAAEFRPLAATFRLVFGSAHEARQFPPPSVASLIGFGWLYALHARSCIARKRLWQAEYMVAGLRNHALALACLRHELPAVHGRGTDRLPSAVTAKFRHGLVERLDTKELTRAFQVVIDEFVGEIFYFDQLLANQLRETAALLKQSLEISSRLPPDSALTG